MKNFLRSYARVLYPLFVAGAGIAIGLIHHIWFFPMDFHADAAAMQVLAQAIVDEGSLLPTDFAYGNQLILFRSSPFIALALICGATGFKAYIIGSALSIGFWVLVLYLALVASTGDRFRAALVAVMLVIPMSIWDHDYILGQQSHLSNVVLSACVVLSAFVFCERRVVAALLGACVAIFLMAAEAPIRSLLVLLPVAIGSLIHGGKQAGAKVLKWTLLAFVLGFIVNKVLVLSRPLGLNLFATMAFRTTDEILLTLQQIGLEMIGQVSSLNVFAPRSMRPLDLAFYLCCLAYFLTVSAYALWRAGALFAKVQRLDKAGSGDVRSDAFEFTATVALLGLTTGALAVSIFKPDTARHIIWAGALLKLSLFLALSYYAARYVKSRSLIAVGLGLALIAASFWVATLVRFSGHLSGVAEARNHAPINARVVQFANQLDIHRVFGGDFWTMIALNTTTPGIAGAAVSLDGADALVPDYWLSRKSMFETDRDVLYLLKSEKTDKLIAAKLAETGGRQLLASEDGEIWVGKPVWARPVRVHEWDGCRLPSKVGKPTAACEMETKDSSASGFLTFGPYVQLPAGQYTFELDYSSAAAADEVVGQWDVVTTRASKLHVLNAGPIKGSLGKAMRIRGSFTVARELSNNAVEIRTLVYPKALMKIRHLKVERGDS